jgi:hypothetical protein
LDASNWRGVSEHLIETSLAIAVGQRVEMDRATRDAWDRGAAVKDAGFQWTSGKEQQ